jgi:hypothetical protein
VAQNLPTKGGYTLLPTSLVNQGARLLPTSLAKGGAQMIDPSVAGTLAGTQYDQAIADAKAALVQQQSDNAQALANVGNWYDQVLGSQGRAATADHNLSQAAQGSERDANASILASLGGGANAAGSAVAAAGQNNLGTLGALGNIEDQYNADLVPLLKLGQAGASSSQQAANARAMAAALQNVQDLTSEKGATAAKYGYDILGQNNQIRDAQATRLLNIMGQNNDTRNTRVSTRASIVGANNSTIQAKQSHDLAVRGANTADKQNQIATILGLGVDPTTGRLTPAAQQALAKVTGMDPSALTGTDAGTAAKIISSKNTLQAREDSYLQKNAPKFSASVSRSLGYRADQFGNPVGGKTTLLPGFAYDAKGHIVKAATGGGVSRQHGLLASQVHKLQGTALTLAETAYHGGHDSKGNELKPLTRDEAILEAQKEGIPAWVYLPALNSFYEPGGKHSPVSGPSAPAGTGRASVPNGQRPAILGG